MRRRGVKKLLRQKRERAKRYGLWRSTGHRTLRRGRRQILRMCPELRDRSSMDPRERIDLMLREVEQLEARARRMSVACLRHMRAVELADIRARHEEELRAAAKGLGQRVLDEFERQAYQAIFGYYPLPNPYYYG